MSVSVESSRMTRAVARASSDELRVLAEELAREFEAPVGLVELATSAWRVRYGVSPEIFPSPAEVLQDSKGAGPAALSHVRVWQPDMQSGVVWLTLPLTLGSGSVKLLALAGFAATPDLTTNTALGAYCPEKPLLNWGRAVADRVARAAERNTQSAAKPAQGPQPARGSDRRPAGALSLIEKLTSSLRVADSPESFQRLAATALCQALRVAAVAWVPSHPREPVIVAGGVDGLSAESFRSLLPDDRERTVRIVNQPPDTADGARKRFAVVAANTEGSSGWFIAVNPLDHRSFSPADVELIRPVASLVGTQRSNARHYADLKELLFGIIRALTSAIDAKDPYTSGHSERVARIAVRLAEELGVAPHDRGDLYLMGLLHDVGKIGIEDDVLKKNGPLTAEEFRVIQSHVRIGVQILSDLKKLRHLLPGVAHHHECIDGSGYPTGLAGENIPLAARILAVADAFDAMSSTRPYRHRLSPTQIDEVLRKGAGKQWDEHVVRALFSCRADLEHIRSRGLGESLNRVVTDTVGRNSLDE